MTDKKIRNYDEGYAIVIYNSFKKYDRNTFVYRYLKDLDDAKYEANSLSKCDGITYAVYDCKNLKIVY